MSIFLNALNGNNNSGKTPIWIMRQAGRYFSKYQEVREDYSFEDMCKTPHIAAQVALDPVNEFGFDAAILFSDILFILEAMGYQVSFENGIEIIKSGMPKSVSTVMHFQTDAIKYTKEGLIDTPLIGFVGGLGTLFYFLHKTGHVSQTEDAFVEFAEEMGLMLAENIALQVDAGVDVFAIFDSKSDWIKEFVDEELYYDMMQALVDSVPDKTPLIYYEKGEHDNELVGIDCFACDDTADIKGMMEDDPDFAFQGNLNQKTLELPHDECVKEIDKYFAGFKKFYPNWICSLGHGITPLAKEENVRYFVQKVRSLSF